MATILQQAQLGTLASKVLSSALVSSALPDGATSPIQLTEEDVGLPEIKEESEIGEKGNPTWNFFGLHLDIDSTIVVFLNILIWTVIWYISGLYKTLRHDPIFTAIFIGYIVYMLANIYTSGSTSGSVVYELNILLTVEQEISILLGTMLMFAVFKDRLTLHPNCVKVVNTLILSCLIVLTSASLWLNVFSTGRSFRAVRKFKQGIYNIALSLFLIIMLIYIKEGKCE